MIEYLLAYEILKHDKQKLSSFLNMTAPILRSSIDREPGGGESYILTKFVVKSDFADYIDQRIVLEVFEEFSYNFAKGSSQLCYTVFRRALDQTNVVSSVLSAFLLIQSVDSYCDFVSDFQLPDRKSMLNISYNVLETIVLGDWRNDGLRKAAFSRLCNDVFRKSFKGFPKDLICLPYCVHLYDMRDLIEKEFGLIPAVHFLQTVCQEYVSKKLFLLYL